MLSDEEKAREEKRYRAQLVMSERAKYGRHKLEPFIPTTSQAKRRKQGRR